MNNLLLTFASILVVLQFVLPRRLAFMPLLIAACHAPYAASWGDFTTIRLVVMAGLIRAGSTGAIRWSPQNPLDVVLAIWSGFALLSAIGHEAGRPFIYRCGLVFNVFGTYLYARAFLRRPGDFGNFLRGIVVVIVPLAGLLAWEAITGLNAYAPLGTRFEEAVVREGRNRARGPFGTPILSGTLGAICIPLMVALWKIDRRRAKIGVAACLVIILTSASSGPIGTMMVGIGAMFLWRWRRLLPQIRLAGILFLILIEVASNREIWYFIAGVDFVGGSTGWHRARLLDRAFDHIGEWWLFGTDYTRHWMPYGLRTDPNHSDLTSYYIHLGVIGGLPLMLSLVAVLWKSFSLLGRRIRQLRRARDPEEFRLWCMGASLFAHTITFFTVSYFDQLFVFFYLSVGVVPLLAARPVKRPAPAAEPINLPPQPAPSH